MANARFAERAADARDHVVRCRAGRFVDDEQSVHQLSRGNWRSLICNC
jgi:hypothetical protein